MKLNNRKDFMTSLPEGEAPRSKKFKYTVLLYFVGISFLVLYLIYALGIRFLFFSETGFVEVEKTTISSISGGRILSLTGEEGEKLRANEVIATIKSNLNCTQIAMANIDNRTENLRFDINSDKLQLKFLRDQIRQIKIEEKENQVFRALELTGEIFYDSEKLLRDKRKLENEANLLNYKLKLQVARLQDMVIINAAEELPQCSHEAILLPFSTTIYSVQKRVNEVVTRSESIMRVIADDAPVRIDFYLNMDLHTSLEVGDVLQLELPGEIKSSGEIEAITSSALNIDRRIFDEYIPVTTKLRVLLKPLDTEQAAIWRSFDQKMVRVRGRK